MDYVDACIENNKYIDITILDDIISDNKELEADKIILMKKAYTYNLLMTKRLIEENRKLKKYVENNQTIVNEIHKINYDNTQKVTTYKDLSLKLDVTNLKKQIDILNGEEMNFYLNSIDKNKKIVTINMLIIKFLEEKQLINKMILEESTDVFNDDLESLTNKINYLINYRDNINTKTINKNHFIYLQTESGNYSIFKDLNIPSEYYNLFDDLFTSMENGEFKNNKIINKSNSSYGETFFEVKSSQARITYIKLCDNVYLIINSFIKKVQTSSLYRENISNDINCYKKQKEYINSQLSDNYDDFIEKNDQVTKQIHEKLFSKKKVK